MTTTPDIIGRIRTKLESLTSATELASDHLETQAIAASANRYQIVALGATVSSPDSSTPRVNVFFKIHVHHKLGAAEAERTYTEGNLQTWCDALVQPDWWRVTDVQDVVVDPEIALDDVRRVGDVVSFTVTAAVSYRT